MSLRLGKRSSKMKLSSVREVMYNIMAVDEGIKPAYLYDAPLTSTAVSLCKFVAELEREHLLHHSLCVVSVEEDVFIMRQDAHKILQKRLLGNNVETVLLDVSPSLDKASPCKQTFTTELITLVLQHLEECLKDSRPVIVTVFPENIPRPTIFGLLLGYPVVYYENTEASSSAGSCLNMVPLKVIKVTHPITSTETSTSFCSFSFSVPAEEYVELKVENIVKGWFKEIENVSSCSKDFIGPVMELQDVVLPAVVL